MSVDTPAPMMMRSGADKCEMSGKEISGKERRPEFGGQRTRSAKPTPTESKNRLTIKGDEPKKKSTSPVGGGFAPYCDGLSIVGVAKRTMRKGEEKELDSDV